MKFEEVVEFDRTEDVKSTKEFASLMLTRSSLDALAKNGYTSPSPVQVQAIPIGLLGFDVVVQAKSGTGKTLVFSLLALEGLNAQSFVPQVLILAPTREIAIQICSVIKRLAPRVVRVGSFVGGEKTLKDDITTLRSGVHIVIGTSGRLCHLVSINALKTENIRLFVLDEADKLMDENFQKDINYLFSCLPDEKQVAVFSATYPHNIESVLAQYMRNARLVRAGSSDVQLIGIKQFVAMRYSTPATTSLVDLLRSFAFKQCIIYGSDHAKCEKIHRTLLENDFNAELISSAIEQCERNRIMRLFKNFNLKILVSTDLTARGIDAENVNAVINIGPPIDCETYLHRIGRAGRFGGYGAAVTILSSPKEVRRFLNLVESGNLRVRLLRLDDEIPMDLCQNEIFYRSCQEYKGCEQKPGRYTRISEKVEATTVPVGTSDEEAQEKSRVLRAVSPVEFDPESSKNADLYDNLQRKLLFSKDFSQKVLEFGGKGQLNGENLENKVERIDKSEKVYSRKDLIQIRDSHSVEFWQSSGDGLLSQIAYDVSYLFRKKRRQTDQSEQRIRTSLKNEFVENKNKKYTFKRTTIRRKVFTKPGLVQIRNSKSSEEWIQHALNRYGNVVFEEPFIMSQPKDKVETEEQTDEPQMFPLFDGEVSRSENTISQLSNQRQETPTYCYSRSLLLAIRDRRISQEWEAWARSRFAVDKEPFQLDPELRVPVPTLLRVLRQREKTERQKVQTMKRNLLTVKSEKQVTARSRYIYAPEPLPNDIDKYAQVVAEEMKNFDFVNFQKQRVGPVVTVRPTPQEYTEAGILSKCSGTLENIKSDFFRAIFCSSEDQLYKTVEDEEKTRKVFRNVESQTDLNEELTETDGNVLNDYYDAGVLFFDTYLRKVNASLRSYQCRIPLE